MKKLMGTTKIFFDDISIEQITDNSGVFMGKNNQKNWSSAIDRNSGFGSLAGEHNRISRNFHLVHPAGRSREGS